MTHRNARTGAPDLNARRRLAPGALAALLGGLVVTAAAGCHRGWGVEPGAPVAQLAGQSVVEVAMDGADYDAEGSGIARLADGSIVTFRAHPAAPASAATRYAPGGDVRALATNSCAVLTDDTARCVRAASGTLERIATGVTQLAGVSDDQGGQNEVIRYGCALTTSGTARCGRLTDLSTTPALDTDGRRITQLAAGTPSRPCALLEDGAVRCWTAGLGTHADDVPGVTGAVEIAVGNAHACARLTDGTARCWWLIDGGATNLGQLGNGTTTAHARGGAIAGLAHVAQLSAAGDHTCARRDDGSVACWGLAGSAETRDPISYQPTEVIGVDHAAAISTGPTYNCAVRADHTVVCWGGEAPPPAGSRTAAHIGWTSGASHD